MHACDWPTFASWWKDRQLTVYPATGQLPGDCPPADLELLRPFPDSAVFPTSGTSGGAKWVVLTRSALELSAAGVNRWLEASGDDVWMMALPERHVGGFSVLLRAALGGSRVVGLSGGWDAVRFVRILEEESVTLVSLVPTQVHDLVHAGLVAPSSLRAVLVGGAFLSGTLASEAVRLGWPLLATYGMTETCSQVATQSWGWAVDDPLRPLWVLPHWRARVGANGCLEVGGPALGSVILENSGGSWRSRPVADGEGWFRTGDLVTLVPGPPPALVVHGRADERIKILGEWFDLGWWRRKVEEEHRAASLVALPDPRAGWALWLVGESGEGEHFPEEALFSLRREWPKFAPVRGWIEVEKIPRSELGKIRRADLQVLAEKAFRNGAGVTAVTEGIS